jgi:type IX secretion system PorP/SprF family membrane protein
VQGQDPFFSQFYATEIYMNPAFAGSHSQPTVSIAFRDQWPGLQSKYLTYALLYDQPVSLIHGGLGLIIMNDQQGGGVIRRTQAGLIYSYQFQVSDELFFHSGIQASYLQKQVNPGTLVFPDMIDPVLGVQYPTGEILTGYRKSLVDFTFGVLGNYHDVFAGLAVHHLTSPNEAFSESQTLRIPRRFSFQAGINLYFGKFRDDPKALVVTPHFLVENQLRYWQLVVGANLSKSPFQAGIRFRQDLAHGFDSFILMAGMSGKEWTAGYSFDLTLPRYGVARPLSGAHELSLSVNFRMPEKRKHIRAIKCPRI